MKIFISIIIVALSYYSYSYGKYLWKVEGKRLSSFGTFFITASAVIIGIYTVFSKL